MELQRGTCSLCSANGKVFTSSTAAEFLKYLPRIFYENFLTEPVFQQIKDSLKICSICCYKLELSRDAKKKMTTTTEDNDISDNLEIQCHFCKSTKCVTTVQKDWIFFLKRTEGFLKLTDFPVNTCYRCMFYFDTIFNFKSTLLYKFPQLAVSTKSQKVSQKNNDTPKRNSFSNLPQNSKKRKIFHNCFAYLQPLCNDNYHIDIQLKSDAKMYKKIPYINLTDLTDVIETPKVRPKIKIKLKQHSKKREREKFQHRSTNEATQENKISQPYVKLCKSEEVPSKVHKENQRRHSLSNKMSSEDSEEKIDETPKAASATNLAPKRRVSLFVELKEADAETEVDAELENKVDTQNVNNVEDISNIVEKYIKDTTFNDTNKLELLQEIEENNIENNVEDNVKNTVEDSVENNIDNSIKENGIQLTEEDSEEITNVDSQDLNNKTNELEPEESLENQEEKTSSATSNEDSETPSSIQEESAKGTPPRSDSNGEGNDSDVSDKCRDKSTLENDSLTGSERKKKRVTFSDEVNL